MQIDYTSKMAVIFKSPLTDSVAQCQDPGTQTRKKM